MPSALDIGIAADLRPEGGLPRTGPDDRFEEWAIGPRDDLHVELVSILDLAMLRRIADELEAMKAGVRRR